MTSEEPSFSIEDALESNTNLGELREDPLQLYPSSGEVNLIEPEIKDDLSLDRIAAILLKDNLLLTALEFHTELIESGKELPRLKDFFSNPGNFEKQGFFDVSPVLPRTSSIQTFDSLDFTRYSDDADRQLDERVAVLEFELRKAKETIKALRANLTVVTESDPSSPKNESYPSAPEATLKPHEKRALNFLVNEYLLRNNYKLASITFCDENEDQDFDDWDDVGLNVPQPPELVVLYRNYCKQTGISQLSCIDAECQTDSTEFETEQSVSETLLSIQLQDELVTLRDKLHLQRIENERLLELLTKSKSDLETEISKRSKLLKGNSFPFEDEIPLNEDQLIRVTSIEKDSEIKAEPVTTRTINVPALVEYPRAGIPDVILNTRRMSKSFQTVLLSKSHLQKVCDEENHLMIALKDIINSESNVVFLLAKCLPRIVPNILLAKREELIPLIICAIILHPQAKERDKLLNLLFNLIKRPDEDQRHMILTGFVAVAETLGPEKVEAELLPQCWEQITHKYPERRILVAESCGVLTPYIPNSIRSSLVLSMLQQMILDEKDEDVRESAVQSLSILLAFLEDVDKFSQALNLLFKALSDDSPKVTEVASLSLLPSLSCWALDIGWLESHLITALLDSLRDRLDSWNEQRKRSNPMLAVKEDPALICHFQALQNVYPFLLLSVIKSGPRAELQQTAKELEVDRLPSFNSEGTDPSVIIGDKNELAELILWFDKYVSEEWYKSWDNLDWILKTFLPSLLKLLLEIDPVNQSIVHSATEGVNFFCRLFGKTFVFNNVRPVFTSIIEKSTSDNSGCRSAYETAVVPVYAAGLLAASYQEENQKALESFLEDTLYALGMSQTTFETVQATFVELSVHINRHELLLTVLWKGVVHVSAVVRSVTGRLFEQLVCAVNEHLLRTRIVPALITLASDPDVDVRASTVPAFGALMEFCTEKELLDKVHMQLQSFLDDPHCKDQQSLLLVIIRTFARVGPNTEPKFRDEFVLPRLAILAAHNNHAISESKRSDICVALLEAYTALSCCFLRDQIIAESFLPGLRCLLRDTQVAAPQHAESVITMIRDFEAKLEANKTVESFQALGFTSAQTSMEDMKNRVTKIFTNRQVGSRPSIPSLFQMRKKM